MYRYNRSTEDVARVQYGYDRCCTGAAGVKQLLHGCNRDKTFLYRYSRGSVLDASLHRDCDGRYNGATGVRKVFYRSNTSATKRIVIVALVKQGYNKFSNGTAEVQRFLHRHNTGIIVVLPVQ